MKTLLGNWFCFHLQVKIWEGPNQFGALMSRAVTSRSKKRSFTGHSDLEDDTVKVFQNVWQQTPRDKASHHRRIDSSTVQLLKLKISKKKIRITREIYYAISRLLRTNTEQKLWGFPGNLVACCKKRFSGTRTL